MLKRKYYVYATLEGGDDFIIVYQKCTYRETKKVENQLIKMYNLGKILFWGVDKRIFKNTLGEKYLVETNDIINHIKNI